MATWASTRSEREANRTSARIDPTKPAFLRRAIHSGEGDPDLAHERPVRLEGRPVVVVTRDDDDLGTRLAQAQQRRDHQLLGRRRRRRRVIDVASYEDGIDLVGLGDTDDLVQDGFLLVQAIASLERLADMPVGGVQELHGLGALLRKDRCAAGVRKAGSRRRPAAVTTRSRLACPASEAARRTPTAASPRRGTGTRARAAPGSAAGRRTSRPASRWWRADAGKPAGTRTRDARSEEHTS